MTDLLGIVGLVLCVLGAAAMLVAALAVDLDSTEAKVLMATAAILFVPGSLIGLGVLRSRLGPPR